MADNYARHALSRRAAFEVTHPAALAAARLFADEPVLRVVDLGAADGVNSHVSRPLGVWSGGGRERGDQPPTRGELDRAHLEHRLARHRTGRTHHIPRQGAQGDLLRRRGNEIGFGGAIDSEGS
jgi:hypothetical protein